MTGPIRVLIVEDRPADAELMAHELRKAGFHPTWERVDNEPDYCARLSDSFDVILCDYKLPQFDGVRALHLLHERELDVPFIIVSGTIGEDVAVRVMQYGADDYLLKDRLTRLPLAVIHALEQKQLRDEQRRAHVALRDSETRFRAMFEKAAVGIAVRDLEGRALECNPAALEMFGYSAEELRHLVFTDYVHPDDAQQERELYQSLVAGQRDHYRMEKRYIRKDGHLLWGDVTVSLVRDAAGQPQFAVVLIQDISERKRAEEDLRQFNEALEQRVTARTRELQERNEQMQGELVLAAEIQRALLPQQYPTFPRGVAPQDSALRFCHRYLPTGTVGGDFFNVMELSNGEAGVFLCDVMGHGVRSALVTAIVRRLVEEHRRVAVDPGQYLAAINQDLLATLRPTGTPLFASAFYMVADAATGTMRYASAGHPRPLLVRRKRGVVEPLRVDASSLGPVLGLIENSVYPTAEVALEVGDLMVLFTDGLYEVVGSSGEDYGLDRLLAAVRARLDLRPEKLFQELLAEIQQYAVLPQFADDVCLLGMEVARLNGTRMPGPAPGSH